MDLGHTPPGPECGSDYDAVRAPAGGAGGADLGGRGPGGPDHHRQQGDGVRFQRRPQPSSCHKDRRWYADGGYSPAAGGLHGGAAPGQSAGDSQRPRRRYDGLSLEKALGLLYAASEREIRDQDPGGPGTAEVRQAGAQAAGQDDTEHHHALAPAHLLHAAVSGRGGRGSGVRSDGPRRREHHAADLYAPGRHPQAESVDKLDAYLSGQPGGKEMPCKSDASQKTV